MVQKGGGQPHNGGITSIVLCTPCPPSTGNPVMHHTSCMCLFVSVCVCMRVFVSMCVCLSQHII